MVVQLSEQAQADLDTIWLYSAQEYGRLHADRVLNRLSDVFDLLADFPGIGLDHPALKPSERFFPVRTYPFLVFFEPHPDHIRIIRVLHERRNVPDQL